MCGRFGLKRGDRVGVVLPNGPEAGVCLMAVSTYATCAPINNNLQVRTALMNEHLPCS